MHQALIIFTFDVNFGFQHKAKHFFFFFELSFVCLVVFLFFLFSFFLFFFFFVASCGCWEICSVFHMYRSSFFCTGGLLHSYNTLSFILPNCIVGRCSLAPVGGGLGVMDVEILVGCQKREATIWSSWDSVIVSPQVWWQEQRERGVREQEVFQLKGERETSAQHCWLHSCPLCTLPQKGYNTPTGLFNGCIPKTAQNSVISCIHTHAHKNTSKLK